MLTTIIILSVVFGVLPLVGMMGVFHKARESIFAVFVPIYNLVVLARVAGCPPLYGLLAFFVPVAGVYWMVLIYLGVAKKFGKEPYYVVFLIFLPFIFFPLLGLGPDEYGQKRKKVRRDRTVIKRTFDEDELEALEEQDEREERARRKARLGSQGEDEDEEEERPRRSRRRIEEEDDEDRPRRRRSRDDEEREEEDRPQRRRVRSEDIEEDRPRPKARRPQRPRDDDDD